MRHTISTLIEGADQVGQTRRLVVSMAARLGFSEPLSARAVLVATEAVTNIWKHAGSGELLLTPLEAGGVTGLELLALDKGPGICNLNMAFEDGYSTAGSPGTGLGAIRRLTSGCDVYTQPSKGTALLARIWNGGNASRERLRVGHLSVPKCGETACGDSFAIHHAPGYTNVMVVDGLGHGPIAAIAAAAAVDAFDENAAADPLEIVDRMHRALRPTRGAAAAVARLDLERRQVRFAGLGNISGVLVDPPNTRQAVCQPGILGHDIRNLKEFCYPWNPGVLVLLYSDGIATHWQPGAYVGLWSRDPALIAGVLYRDFCRGRDDATILALREGRFE